MWYALEVDIVLDAREAVEYGLMESGALGTEFNETPSGLPAVTGYFERFPDREEVRHQLAEALRIHELPTSFIRDMHVREVPDQDWLAEWKADWQPVVAGERFIIAPPWSDVQDTDRIVIRIEPGMAFGTGTHETTRLCLSAIEKYFAGGSFLDVGTGTGILAIAAAKLFGGARVAALDTDAQAIEIAKENAELNAVGHQIQFSIGSVDDSTASADFVCANLTAEVIESILPKLIGATCGRLVMSGILDTQLDLIVDRLHQCGVAEPTEIMHDGEWVTVVI